METVIDWSKAPEGATHWTPYSSVVCQFLKFDKKWFWFGEGWTEYGPGNDWMTKQLSGVVSRPETVWTGEGLPPVGTVCEFMKHNAEPVPDGQWTVGDIRYVSDCYVIIGGNRCEHAHHPRNCSFRKIRTPEQIAAEERDKELQEFTHQIYCDIQMEPRDAELLFNRGYRKQVAP